MASLIYYVASSYNSLWYIPNQHLTISDAALSRKETLPVPAVFEKFQGYNDLKRKKLKSAIGNDDLA